LHLCVGLDRHAGHSAIVNGYADCATFSSSAGNESELRQIVHMGSVELEEGAIAYLESISNISSRWYVYSGRTMNR
jgi:hypothetical protein